MQSRYTHTEKDNFLFQIPLSNFFQKARLQSQLGATPVTALGIPLDLVVSTKTDPVRQGAVLPLLLGERSLCSKSLLGRL